MCSATPASASSVYYFDDSAVYSIKYMVRNHGLAKSTSDTGWNQFLTVLTHKIAIWHADKRAGIHRAGCMAIKRDS